MGSRQLAVSIILVLGCSGDPEATPDGGDAVAIDAPAADAATPLCNGTTGLRAPLPTCSPERPCVRIAAELPQVAITTPTEIPACGDSRWDERLAYPIGDLTRYACVARAPGASAASRRPLVVWLHPGGEGADNAEQETRLLDKLARFDLTADPARPGFSLVVPQGRNLHFPTLEPRDGRHHDFYYRDLGSPSTNPDVANLDALIDRLVAEGHVDPARIFVMGWSNGAFFGQLYAIARHATATPGGSRVAAAAVFAAADPFGDVRYDPFAQRPTQAADGSCQLTSYPTSAVPIQLTYRTCDGAVACGASDAACVVARARVRDDDVARARGDDAAKPARPRDRRRRARRPARSPGRAVHGDPDRELHRRGQGAVRRQPPALARRGLRERHRRRQRARAAQLPARSPARAVTTIGVRAHRAWRRNQALASAYSAAHRGSSAHRAAAWVMSA
jgi:poly(3-hydroxybutyrate) depolymerase